MGAPHRPMLKGEGGGTSPNFLYLRIELSHNYITTFKQVQNPPPGKSIWWDKGIFNILCFLFVGGRPWYVPSISRSPQLVPSHYLASRRDQGAGATWPFLKSEELKGWLELLMDAVPMQVMPTLWTSHLCRSCSAVSLVPITGCELVWG